MNQSRKVCLFGDTEMIEIASAMSKMGIDYLGGMVINASDLINGHFSLCHEKFFTVESKYSTDVEWSDVVTILKNEQIKPLVVTNFAVQTTEIIDAIILDISKTKEIESASLIDYVNCIKKHQERQLSVIKSMSEAGFDVTVVSDPPFFIKSEAFIDKSQYVYKYFNALEFLLSEYGIKFINMALLFNNSIENVDDYMSVDVKNDIQYFSGNEKYYAWMVRQIMDDKLIESYWFNSPCICN